MFEIRETYLASLSPKKRKLAENLIQMLQLLPESDDKHIRTPEDIYRLSIDMTQLYQEHFDVYFLNTKNRIIARETLSIGSLNASIVHPREVFRAAIMRSSASIICVHNHPSGDPTPSPQDIELTLRLMEAGEIVGIEVLDHVIVGKDGFCSLKQGGYI